jgi:aspartate-semialdehyde dehydrogenase
MAFLKANFAVFSNAKNYRLAPQVPLIVPMVNPGHIDTIPAQRKHYQLDKGLLVCNSNCAVIGLVIPAAALIQKFGPIDQVSMVTMQAVSGAGYPGVSSKLSSLLPIKSTRGWYILDITANHVRYGYFGLLFHISPERNPRFPPKLARF